MDPGNINTIPDYSDIRTELRLGIQSSEDINEIGEIVLNWQERIFSLVNSNFTEIFSQYSSLEGSELERIRADFQEIEVMVTEVKRLVESGKKVQGEAKDKLESMTLDVSKDDFQNEVTEIIYLLNVLEDMASLIYEFANQFQPALFYSWIRTNCSLSTKTDYVLLQTALFPCWNFARDQQRGLPHPPAPHEQDMDFSSDSETDNIETNLSQQMTPSPTLTSPAIGDLEEDFQKIGTTSN
ncbi:hypothetical protein TNCV_4761691 [Trichonephila clavipes]|uniref:Uncharacterized protein n=1 Tax=Trichonephila clavipes TaxID=2585209 RepID=A0A8X6REQ9_TRICX|nr:hypothetical protein TNCV_4761691 [Trichonephila clavipes]